MASQSYQTPQATRASTPAAALTDEAGPDNSAVLAQTGLGGVMDTVGDWAGGVWDWLWGNDTAEQGEQQGSTLGSFLDSAMQTVCRVTSGVPSIDAVADVNAADVRTTYANNPRAQTALDALTNDPNFAKLSAEQQGGLLQRFQQAPNAATTQYLQGLAAYHATPNPCDADMDAYNNALNPDGGTFTSNGTTYSIVNGQLMDADGNVAGDIRTDGTYQLTGQEQRSSYYDDIHSRVKFTEGTGDQQRTLLDLHDADPANTLTDANVNPTFAGMATDTFKDLRREGLDMRVDLAYRSNAQQDEIYNRRDGTTNARGGESWHNYGVAADFVFNDANGRKSWPDGGEYTRLWSRLGELGESNGLEWGGRWRRPDRPHLEYHPGYTASNASSLAPTVRRGGLQAAWDAMGIGTQPAGQ